MGNVNPNIKPTGLKYKDEVDLWYMIVSSLAGICAKLDADAGVTDTTYLANCYTAIINTVIRDSKDNLTGQLVAEENFYNVSPSGITDAARLQLLYNTFNALETLCEQLDLDAGVTDTTHEALCYTAILLHMVEDTKGNILGNGNSFYFRPGGIFNQKEYVDCLYNIVNALETLTEQLDAGGGVTDTDYEALWFTATILLMIEDSKGNQIGVSR